VVGRQNAALTLLSHSGCTPRGEYLLKFSASAAGSSSLSLTATIVHDVSISASVFMNIRKKRCKDTIEEKDSRPLEVTGKRSSGNTNTRQGNTNHRQEM